MAKQQLAPPDIAYRKQFARHPSVAHRPLLSAEQKAEYEKQAEALEKTRRDVAELMARVAQLQAKIEPGHTGNKDRPGLSATASSTGDKEPTTDEKKPE
jgi:hypothetical protein